MFGQKFYNGIIRKYVIYFGTLFNQIEIDRTDSSGDVIQSIRVPISYAPRAGFIERINVDPNLDRQVAVQLPRMAFEMTSFTYAPERRLNPAKKIYNTKSGDNHNYKSMFTPTPFDITFSLAIAVKNAEDGVRILEQILPFFTPEYTATLKLVDDMDIKMDIPVVFQSLQTEDSFEGDFITRRAIIHTIDFVVKGYLFGRVNDQAGLIRTANTRFFVDESDPNVFQLDGEDEASKVVIKPGLDANGNPTSNSSASINIDSITANDNFGYIINKTVENG
jgi:hypothetical protein|tara:strand:+ start:132 stop:965 length:834 start_codon:yes stop_codon:yes gene_type:complete